MTLKPGHPLSALLLAAATLCLGVTLLILWILSSGQAGLGATVFLGLGVVVYPISLILLIVYAMLDKPWTRPFRHAWFFWLQVLAIVIIGMRVAAWR